MLRGPYMVKPEYAPVKALLGGTLIYSQKKLTVSSSR
jgi:hypothetical protein